MRERTLKEQEYQVVALKYRAEAAFSRIWVELGLGSWIVFGLLHLHWIAASLVGAYSILGVINLSKRWLVVRYEYVTFKSEFDQMVMLGDPNTLPGKIMASVKEGEKWFEEHKDDTID